MNPRLATGIVLAALPPAMAALSFAWPADAVVAIDIAHRLQAPSAAHWLGTDGLGRDIALLLLFGARTSLTVGAVSVAIGALAGIAVGLLAAARRGWIDEALMRASDFAFAFPALLTAIVLAAVAGPGVATTTAAIALFNLPVFARLTHATAAQVWAREHVLAARAYGMADAAITRRHVLPNVAALLVVQATVQVALAVLAEAGLSYLGLGTQPPQASWGRMLNEAQQLLFQAPRLALWPGLAIALTVLGLNLLGEGLRDRLDPRRVRER